MGTIKVFNNVAANGKTRAWFVYEIQKTGELYFCDGSQAALYNLRDPRQLEALVHDYNSLDLSGLLSHMIHYYQLPVSSDLERLLTITHLHPNLAKLVEQAEPKDANEAFALIQEKCSKLNPEDMLELSPLEEFKTATFKREKEELSRSSVVIHENEKGKGKEKEKNPSATLVDDIKAAQEKFLTEFNKSHCKVKRQRRTTFMPTLGLQTEVGITPKEGTQDPASRPSRQSPRNRDSAVITPVSHSTTTPIPRPVNVVPAAAPRGFSFSNLFGSIGMIPQTEQSPKPKPKPGPSRK